MIYFLLLTAFTVSIDSFVCGFSLSFYGKRKFYIVLIIALTVLAMCTITNYLAVILSDVLNNQTTAFGGLILIAVGLYNIFKNDNVEISKKHTIKQTFITGFAVGLDGAVANLSLALMGINAFYVPVTIALMHAVMIALGIAVSQTKPAKKLGKLHLFPPIVLILLGIYKIIAIFL